MKVYVYALVVWLTLYSVCWIAGCKQSDDLWKDQIPFSSARWKESDAEGRARMVSDLVGIVGEPRAVRFLNPNSQLAAGASPKLMLSKDAAIFGKRRAEIIGMLGPPDHEDAQGFRYRVGYLGERGPNEEPFYLLFYFHDTGELHQVIVSD